MVIKVNFIIYLHALILIISLFGISHLKQAPGIYILAEQFTHYKFHIMKKESKVLIALVAGLAIGGLLGVLFSPGKGADTRKKIAQAGNDFADKVKDSVNKGRDTLNGLKDEVQQIITMKKDNA